MKVSITCLLIVACLNTNSSDEGCYVELSY